MTAKRSRRLLSITFDDGLRNGAEIACEILAAYRLQATFYVVTGWIEPIRTSIRESYNAGRSHGDWQFWRGVRDAGHEVGSHTFSHVNAGGKKALIMPWLVGFEIGRSKADLVREVPQARYTISMPWNAATARSERHVRSHFCGCRVGSALAYNRLDALETYRLASWAPPPSLNESELEKAIAAIPENGWLILQFHSFDDEGWEPISRARFSRLCEIAASDDELAVRTIADVVGELAAEAALSSS